MNIKILELVKECRYGQMDQYTRDGGKIIKQMVKED